MAKSDWWGWGESRKSGGKKRKRNPPKKKGAAKKLTKAQRRAISLRNLAKAHRARRAGARRPTKARRSGGVSSRTRSFKKKWGVCSKKKPCTMTLPGGCKVSVKSYNRYGRAEHVVVQTPPGAKVTSTLLKR